MHWLRDVVGMPPAGAEQALRYVADGRRVLGVVPTLERIAAERFFDESGGMQLVLETGDATLFLSSVSTNTWGETPEIGWRPRFTCSVAVSVCMLTSLSFEKRYANSAVVGVEACLALRRFHGSGPGSFGL